MRLRELLEARKNPIQNPKVSVNQEIIDAYKNAPIILATNDNNCFVSFTELDKLGINPTSSYRTPIGIYAYPASYIIEKIGTTKSMNDLPFAGDQPFANIFSVNGNILDISSNKDIFSQYYRKIAEFYAEHSNLPWKQAVDQIEDIINNAHKNAKFPRYPGGKFWYITMETAIALAKPRTIQKQDSKTKEIKSIESDSAPVEWNKLFRYLDIDGFVDYGIGIIHTSEPYQAVFFSKNVIKNNKRVYNKYSPEQQQNSIQTGHSAQLYKKTLKTYTQAAQTLDPISFIKKYKQNGIRYVTDVSALAKLIKYDPLLFQFVDTRIMNQQLAELAVSLNPINWIHVPKKFSSFELFKLAVDNADPSTKKEIMDPWSIMGSNSIATQKMKDYINQLNK